MDIRAIAMGLLFAFIWSSAFTSARIIVADAPPLASLAMRFFVSGIIGVMIARALGQTLESDPRAMARHFDFWIVPKRNLSGSEFCGHANGASLACIDHRIHHAIDGSLCQLGHFSRTFAAVGHVWPCTWDRGRCHHHVRAGSKPASMLRRRLVHHRCCGADRGDAVDAWGVVWRQSDDGRGAANAGRGGILAVASA